MIKDEMNFTLAVDTADIKATDGVLYSASDDEIKAYTIGYVPFTLISESVLLQGLSKGDFVSTSTDLSYTVSENFPVNRGVPFCYSYAASSTAANINAYFDGVDYINLPWGTTTTTGMIHSYNTDEIVLNNPSSISETSTIHAVFEMFVVYLPDGSTGGASTGSGENGWVTKLAQKTAEIDILDLSFSVTSDIDGSYMPTAVTFTKTDLENADSNGIMKISNGTITYSGVVYNITVYCAITTAYLPGAGNLKDGFLQLDNMRYSAPTDADTPMYTKFPHNTTKTDVFVCNGITEGITIAFPADTYYYIEVSENSYDYFKWTTYYSDSNNFLSGGFNVADLKILRSIARPVYKISGAFYVAEFNDDFTITGDLIPYANAREWQKNINGDTNDFDYKDIPDPTPGEEGENVGDSVILPSVFGVGTTNGFVTQYALRKSDIQQLGALLWTSFVDADYWQNYLFSLALDTGTFSLAGLMSFFVSLKVYPFPLVNVSGLVSEGGNDMYVGTGIVPLHFTNKLHSLTSYVDKIEGGYVDVMSANFFKDWRDYVNTEIILYVPYCGTIHLNPADVVGNRVRIRYVIDFSTGGCVAYVMCDASGEKSFMIGALPGQIGADVPLSASAAGEIAARFIGDAMNAGHLVGGEVGNIASGIAGATFGKNDNDHPIMGGGSGSPFAGIAGVYGGLPGAMGADLAPGIASQALSMLTRSAVSAPLMSGGRGFASFGAPQVPYIQIRRGIYPEITKLSEISGKPSAGTYKVGDLSGFVSGVVKTDGINAHENEKAKIRRLIAGGIYV